MSVRREASWVFALAVLVRVVYVYEQSSNAAFWMPLVDAEVFDRAASTWAQSSTFEQDGFFFHGFAYPFFLGLTYWFFGASAWIAKYAQCVIAGLTCALTYALARRYLSRGVALGAAAIVTFYGPLMFVETDLVAEGLATFLVLVLIFFEPRVRSERAVWWVVWGVCSALCVLTRASLLPFVLLYSGYVLLSVSRARQPMAWAKVAWVGIGAAMVVMPMALLNHHETGHYAVLPASGGINAFIGNNAERCATMTTRPGIAWNRLVDMPRAGGRDSLWVRDAYFWQQTRDWVATHPFAFLRGLAAKSATWLSARELPRNLDIYLYRPSSMILSATTWKMGGFGFPFGVLLPLALLGGWSARKRVPMGMWLFLVSYSFVHVLIFSSSRYRVVMVPVLAVLASAGVARLVHAAKQGLPALAKPMVVVVVVGLLISFPVRFCEERHDFLSEQWFMVGAGYERLGNAGAAESYYRRVLKRAPGYAEAHHLLAKLLQNKHRRFEAAIHYERASALEPYADILVDYGRLLGEMGRLPQAIGVLERAVALDSQSAEAHNNLGTALAFSGDLPRALPHFEAAKRLDASSPLYEKNFQRAARQLAAQGTR